MASNERTHHYRRETLIESIARKVWQARRNSNRTATLKSIGAIRLWIAEGSRSGNHLGDETPGCGAEREPPMGMAEGEPQSRLPRRRPNDGSRVRKTWPAAQPGHCFYGIAQRKQRTRRRQQPVELRRRRRPIARGELGAGREPQPLLHRSDAIADVGINHGA